MDINEKKARDLLSELSLEEKVAQIGGIMYMPEMKKKISAMLTYGMGEISTLCVREMKTLSEAVEWQRALQKEIIEKSPHHIPAIFHMEGLCGPFFQGSVSLPSGVSRGASFDTDLEEKLGALVAKEELSCGITHVLAPVLDVTRDPRMGRCGESYGEDPTAVAAMGTSFTKGIQEAEEDGRHADAVAKHFFGFHSSSAGVHGAEIRIGRRDHLETFGKPFQAAIAEGGLKGVMPCYCSVDGVPFSLSKEYLTDILRGEMGFDGCVFADYGAVSNAFEFDHVGTSYGETGLSALSAGMDQELPFPRCFNQDDFARAFREGKADMALLDRAVLRVLTAKFRMGLFDHPYAEETPKVSALFEKPEAKELTLQSARESLVLLKNENNVLPLDRKLRKIAVIGPQAANARYFFGGYTHMDMMTATLCATNSMAGVEQEAAAGRPADIRLPGTQVQDDEQEGFDEVLKRQKPDCRNLLEELKDRLPDTEIVWAKGFDKYGNDHSAFEEALDAAKDADLILLTLGGKWGSGSICTMGEGIDTMNIGLPQGQEAFIEEASKLNIPMVGLHFSGRPLSSDIADERLSAILECWAPAEAGAEAVVDVLTGKAAPSGKLPVCTARNAGQLPVYYYEPYGTGMFQADSIGFTDYVDGSHKPRYFFGHGLSYTTFEYSGLKVEKETVQPHEALTVSFDVKNTGSREGTETVFLFLRDDNASMVRPNMLLSGFARVPLSAGETKRVTFEVSPSQTAFLTGSRDIEWKIEAGDIGVRIGAAADDIRLEGKFRIAEDALIEGKMRKFYSPVKMEER